MKASFVLPVILTACGGQAILTDFGNGQDAGPTYPAPDDQLSKDNCPTTNVWRHTSGSWILTAPQIHLVFWGSYWSTTPDGGVSLVSTETQAWNTLANDPSFYNPVREYGVLGGRLLGTSNGYWSCPSGALQESDIQNELNAEISNGTLPNPDTQTIYVLMLPSGTQSQYDIDNSFGGHHNYIGNFSYAVIEYSSTPDGTISHEIYEAATNPDTSNAWWGPGGETEIGDLCSSGWKLDGYNITKVWSETFCQCVP